jgi:dihydrofolate reductase
MGELVVTEFVTLDGVMQDPGGSGEYERGGWAFKFDRGPEGDAFKLDELMASDAQLLGRVTYEGFAKAWPKMEGTGEFGEKFNSMPKYVVSKTLKDPEWNNSHVLDGDDLAADVAGLKQQYEGDILVAGSAQLVQSLLALDLVDELRLMIFPTILGRGRRVFPDGIDRLKLKLVESRTVGPDGVQVQVYRRAA